MQLCCLFLSVVMACMYCTCITLTNLSHFSDLLCFEIAVVDVCVCVLSVTCETMSTGVCVWVYLSYTMRVLSHLQFTWACLHSHKELKVYTSLMCLNSQNWHCLWSIYHTIKLGSEANKRNHFPPDKMNEWGISRGYWMGCRWVDEKQNKGHRGGDAGLYSLVRIHRNELHY